MFWPVFSFASAGMNAGTTFDMGSRHTSLPPITSSRNASLYHATLPPVRITTGTLMAAKASLRRAGCIRSAVQQTRQPVPEPADVQPDHDAHNEQHAHDKKQG